MMPDGLVSALGAGFGAGFGAELGPGFDACGGPRGDRVPRVASPAPGGALEGPGVYCGGTYGGTGAAGLVGVLAKSCSKGQGGGRDRSLT
jgi:hypothetical protein